MIRIYLLLAVSLLVVVANANKVNDLPFTLSWMNANDRAELEKVEASQRGRFLAAIFAKSDEEQKSKIRNDVIPSCYASWMSGEEREELETLHNSGDHEKCKERVHELLESLSDEKRTNVQNYWSFCEAVWYSTHDQVHHIGHHHKRRHSGRHNRHVHTDYDDFAAEHLAWMSEDEKEEIKKLHDESKEKARVRIFEIFDQSTGDKRSKAITQLQAACRELIVHTFGEETAKSLRQMKDLGTSDDAIKAKIDELLKDLNDETKKAKVLEYKDSCDKIYKAKASSRRRREEARHHGLESKLRGEWKWLTEEQKEIIRNFKNEGKSDEFLLTKVFEYFKSAEAKDVAEDGLQQSCQGAVLTILGAEKAQVLKEFMAQGAKPEAYEAKVKELLNQQAKDMPRQSLNVNQKNCKLVFTESSRKRRSHHEHTLDHYLNNHLSWLTDEQKTELRKLHEDEKDEDKLHAKVMEWYEQSTGVKKEQATSALKAGCRDILLSAIGSEKMEEVKKLKESGGSPSDLATKVEELIKNVDDETKVKRVKKYEVQCKKLFGVGASRKRRDDESHSHSTLEDYLSTHLAWLTEAQKNDVRKLKSEGKTREELHSKVMAIYDSLTGEVKEKATAELQSSCREAFAQYFTPEQMAELKQMKESGAPKGEISDKGDKFVSEIADAEKKKNAQLYSGSCRKVFGVNR